MNAEPLLRQLLDAIPSFVFLLDEDLRVLDYNAAAGELTSETRERVLLERSGDVLHCIHSTDSPEGCGRGDFCKTCLIRKSVGRALAQNVCVRTRTRMELQTNAGLRPLSIVLTASPFSYENRRLVLLVLEDISELIDLQRLVPICAHCKKVRDDDEYWSHVETYMEKHLDIQFTHSVCPECFAAQEAEIDQ
ncbi:MAG TPA: PAS domain-containing protein [Candidatus Acidoferrum sp.]|jgi:PAS domain-containing protein|nr:PAS domain-containing protein [Candidatus Acidoferrum sp.]